MTAHMDGEVGQQVPPANMERHSGSPQAPQLAQGCIHLLLKPGLQLPQLRPGTQLASESHEHSQ